MRRGSRGELVGGASTFPGRLRQRRASLEPDAKALLVERPDRVCHPVVLLDETRSDAAFPGCNGEEILKLGGVVDEGHTAARIARSMRASTAFVA